MKKRELIPVFRPNYGTEEIRAITEVLKSGWIGLGPKTAEFEKRFAKYVGAKYAVALNSATAALHLSLVTANIKKGDEVIVPALTFVSTAHAVLYVGARPIFADIEFDTLCLSPTDAEKKITTRTKAIILVHYGGHPGNIKEFRKLAKKYNLVLIEDAAHACGSSYGKRKIGSINPFTCFSFHAVKNLATGDGGIITTNNKKVAERLRLLRWMGISKSTWGRIKKVTNPAHKTHNIYGWYYEVKELGYKYHINDIASSIGIAQLKKLEAANKKRRKLAEVYTKRLSSLSGIQCPTVKPDVVTSQHNYAIRYDLRDDLHLHLREKGISTGVHYMPLYLHPFYRKSHAKVHLPVTESEWVRLLLLPMYPQLTSKEQNYIIETIKEFIERSDNFTKRIKKHCPPISGDKTRLRLAQSTDKELMRKWRNRNRAFFIDHSYISKKQQKTWFKKYKDDPNDLIFIIQTTKAKPIGTISLYRIDQKNKKAEYGRMLIGDEKFRGKGYAKDATRAIIDYAFSYMNLNYLTLELLKDNHRGAHFYKRFGFRKFKDPTRDSRKIIVMKLKKKL